VNDLPPTGRDRIAAEYGERVVQALDDFLNHADEAAWALAERDRVDVRVARMMAESLVIRLGEAVNRVGRPFADAHRGLNLRGVAAARNFAAHGYDVVDHEILWTSFERDLPPTVAQLRRLLE